MVYRDVVSTVNHFSKPEYYTVQSLQYRKIRPCTSEQRSSGNPGVTRLAESIHFHFPPNHKLVHLFFHLLKKRIGFII